MEKAIMKLDLKHQSTIFDVIREMLKQDFLNKEFYIGNEIAEIDEAVIKIRRAILTEEGIKSIRQDVIRLAGIVIRLASKIEVAKKPDTGHLQVWFECDNCGARNWTEIFVPEHLKNEGSLLKLIECPECVEPLFAITPKPEGDGQ